LPKVLDGVSLPDLVIKVICPATETHIKKYTAQERKLVVETPEKYEKVVVPYIESFPPSRIEWYVSGETLAESRVYNILDGVKEAERVVHLDKDPETGFVLVPDLKWDQTSMKALVS
jgi:m7GpppX diphosphatase